MSYVLPEDTEQFEAERAEKENQNMLYILKPVAASCGRGIKIISSQQKLGK